MRGNDIRQNLLPIGATVILAVGAVLILAGVAVLFGGKPRLGGLSYPLYDILMIGGEVFMFLGTWISRRWYKEQKSRTG